MCIIRIGNWNISPIIIDYLQFSTMHLFQGQQLLESDKTVVHRTKTDMLTLRFHYNELPLLTSLTKQKKHTYNTFPEQQVYYESLLESEEIGQFSPFSYLHGHQMLRSRTPLNNSSNSCYF